MKRIEFVLELSQSELPQSCFDCRFCEANICHLPEKRNGDISGRYMKRRCPDCPLRVVDCEETHG